MEGKNKKIIFIALIVAIIALILLINYLKSNGELNEQTMQCIANKAELYVSKTCGHCVGQKQILGEYIDYFTITDCLIEKEKCTNAGIARVPTWIINNEKYPGKLSIKQLINLTKC